MFVRKALFVRKVLAGTSSELTGAIDRDAAGFKMTAAGAGSVAVGAASAVGFKSVFTDGDEGPAAAGIGNASGSVVATKGLAVDEAGAVVEDAVEVAFAVAVGAAAESEAGVDAEAGVNPRPSFTGTGTRARADDPKKANNMAAMASLTSLPLT